MVKKKLTKEDKKKLEKQLKESTKQLEDTIKHLQDEKQYMSFCKHYVDQNAGVWEKLMKGKGKETVKVPRFILEQMLSDFQFYLHQKENKSTLQGVPISMVLFEHHNIALLLLSLTDEGKHEGETKQDNNNDSK